MKLIVELNEDVKFVTEANESGKKEMYIEGVFMQADKQNRNGRVYPFEVLNREASRYINEYVNKGRAFGELGHPAGPTINLERVSHLIKELNVVGSDFYGKAKILDTPYGNIVRNLINEGASFGVSTRGMGTLVEKNGTKIVSDDFYLATAADIVADPSAPDAFVRGIMESKEWVMVNGCWMEQDIDRSKNLIRKTSSKNLQQAKLKIFEDFIKRL
jgi:Prohead core protein serine protease